MSTAVEEEVDLRNDPFDFTNYEYRPDLVKGINWNSIYDWAPRLREFQLDDNDVSFRGRKSDLAQAVLHHLGHPLRLENHAFMLPVYNNDDDRIVLKCSRQVAKSSTIAVLQTLESVIHPHWRSLYVSPSALQTRQYSNEKLRPTIYESPFVQNVFVGKGVTDQVFEKTLLNGSYMFLRYAFLTAARARGIPASRVFFDEAQDLLKDNVKIISESLSASKLSAGVTGRELIAGTPLTFQNTLEEYWRWSTQNEWLVPCDCKLPRYWNFLDERCIGKKGLMCSNCGKAIDAAAGQWVAFAPNEFYVGYHISQLMVPWKQGENEWRNEIVLPMEKWPANKFHNEKLGFAYDNAHAPVTQMDLQKCCYPARAIERRSAANWQLRRGPDTSGLRIFAGIDWGEGRAEGEMAHGKKKFASWTVLTLGAYVTEDLFWPFFMKKYTGDQIDPEFIVPDVLNICGHWNVEIIGADWGHGWGVNSRLFKARGRTGVMQFHYSHNLGERKQWDEDAYKWIVNRNAVLSQFFTDIKQGHFQFPSWEVFEPFGKDILAEYVEYNELTRTMKYDHPIDQPDDGLHSIVFCKLTADIMRGRY